MDGQQYLQELDDVASSKHPVSNGELVRLSGREVRGQDALVHAPPAQDLAGGARAEDRRLQRRQWGIVEGRRRRRRWSGWRRGLGRWWLRWRWGRWGWCCVGDDFSGNSDGCWYCCGCSRLVFHLHKTFLRRERERGREVCDGNEGEWWAYIHTWRWMGAMCQHAHVNDPQDKFSPTVWKQLCGDFSF